MVGLCEINGRHEAVAQLQEFKLLRKEKAWRTPTTSTPPFGSDPNAAPPPLLPHHSGLTRMPLCEDFIRTRLAPAEPPNDGKQTPMRGHPVFKAQHACACCCRDCLAKWWKVPRGVAIPAERQQGIVDFLMFWIEREMGLRRL